MRAVDDAAAPAREVAPDRCPDREALADWLVHKRPALIGYLCNHLDDKQLAEDLAQDVLVRALAHLDEVDTDRALWPWLMIIARNRLIDHFRRGATAGDALDDPRITEALSPGGSPSEMSEFADPATRYEECELLALALDSLGRRQRSALLLHDADDWTSEQLAVFFGRDRNAVHQLLYRARAAARKEYVRLSEARGPRALLPWPLVWAGDRLRRAAARTRDLVQQASTGLPAVGGSTAAVAATLGVGAALLLTTGAPPSGADATDPDHTVPATARDAAGTTSQPTAGGAGVPGPVATLAVVRTAGGGEVTPGHAGGHAVDIGEAADSILDVGPPLEPGLEVGALDELGDPCTFAVGPTSCATGAITSDFSSSDTASLRTIVALSVIAAEEARQDLDDASAAGRPADGGAAQDGTDRPAGEDHDTGAEHLAAAPPPTGDGHLDATNFLEADADATDDAPPVEPDADPVRVSSGDGDDPAADGDDSDGATTPSPDPCGLEGAIAPVCGAAGP